MRFCAFEVMKGKEFFCYLFVEVRRYFHGLKTVGSSKIAIAGGRYVNIRKHTNRRNTRIQDKKVQDFRLSDDSNL